MPGLFITFEGLDGSGKSSHLARLAADLAAAGTAVTVTHEPGGTPLGDALRAVFLDPRWGTVDGTVEALVVFAARRQHLLEVVDPALAAGAVVLCDRFTDSTLAYQGSGRGVSAELIARVDALATGCRRPDRTVLFDLPPEAARHRGHVGRSASDRLDREELDFYRRVRAGFLALAAADPGRFRIVDSAGPPKETARQVRAALADLLPALAAASPACAEEAR